MKIINLSKNKDGVYVPSTDVECIDNDAVLGKVDCAADSKSGFDMFLDGVDIGIDILEKISGRVSRMIKVSKI